MFGDFKNIHFVGIGGIGMSGIARILLDRGYLISGSDLNETKLTEKLKEKGAVIYRGHSQTNISNSDLIVFTAAVDESNPELTEAIRRKIPIVKRSEMLAECLRFNYSVCVAGTHGKTTTTSMIGVSLMESGLDPTIIVGGELEILDGWNARSGKGKFAAVEADEFDRSFLKLNPSVAVLTNLEAEHLDVYRDLDDLKKSFGEFASMVPFFGFIALSADDKNLSDALRNVSRRKITFGLNPSADLRASEIRQSGKKTVFLIVNGKDTLQEIELNLPGVHNIRNALAAAAVLIGLNLDLKFLSTALKKFTGVRRRFEVKYDKEIMVIDDYAHHPTEISSTINAARSGWKRRLICIFQPHLYSRTRDFSEDFAVALTLADIVFVTDIYPAREKPLPGITSELIAQLMKEKGHMEAYYVSDKNRLLRAVSELKKEGDIIVFLGAGDITSICNRFVEGLNESQ